LKLVRLSQFTLVQAIRATLLQQDELWISVASGHDDSAPLCIAAHTGHLEHIPVDCANLHRPAIFGNHSDYIVGAVQCSVFQAHIHKLQLNASSGHDVLQPTFMAINGEPPKPLLLLIPKGRFLPIGCVPNVERVSVASVDVYRGPGLDQFGFSVVRDLGLVAVRRMLPSHVHIRIKLIFNLEKSAESELSPLQRHITRVC
jgi:hypothetical protein